MERGLRKMTRKQTGRTSNTETFETEIVVIGGGGGLAAGVAASGEGAKVMLLEKLKKTGGNIVMATGFLAAESPVQRRMKIDAIRAWLFNKWIDQAHWTIDPGIVGTIVCTTG